MFRLEYDSSGEVQDNLAFDRKLLSLSILPRFTTKQTFGTADHIYHEERANDLQARVSIPLTSLIILTSTQPYSRNSREPVSFLILSVHDHQS